MLIYLLVHPIQQIIAGKRLQEGSDIWAFVSWDNSSWEQFRLEALLLLERGYKAVITICKAIGRVGRWRGIILSAEVTVLRIRAIAKVGPKSMQCPRVRRKQLTLTFETSVRVPVLGAQQKTAVCFGAAGVHGLWVCSTRARQHCVIICCGCGGLISRSVLLAK